VNQRGALAHAGHDFRCRQAFDQASQIAIVGRIGADDCVFHREQRAFVDEFGEPVDVDLTLAFDIERERHAGDIGEASEAARHAFRRREARERQNHRLAVVRLREHLALIGADGPNRGFADLPTPPACQATR
jgi:hypothetical protein